MANWELCNRVTVEILYPAFFLFFFTIIVRLSNKLSWIRNLKKINKIGYYLLLLLGSCVTGTSI